VKIWDAATGQLLQSSPAPDFNLSFPPLITSISWNPDGNRLAITASASTQPSAYLWVLDLTTGQTTEFDAESLTYTAAWSPDGSLLAAGVTFGDASSGKHWIKVWDVASQQLVANLEGYSDLIFSVAWSPDGTRLASCSADATAAIWDTTTWTRLLTLGEWPTQAALWGSWSPDGTRLATTSVNGTAGIWNAVTGELLMTLFSDDDEPLFEIVWHPTGSQLAGVSEHAIKLWDAATGAQIGKLETTERLNTLAWSPDGTQILLGGIGLRQPLTIDPTALITPPPSSG
jgi:WD40 repeat protein